MLLRLYNDDSPLIDHSKERPNGSSIVGDPKENITASAAEGLRLTAADVDVTDANNTPLAEADNNVELGDAAADADLIEFVAPNGVGTENAAVQEEDRLKSQAQINADAGNTG